MLPFLQNFSWAFVRMDDVYVPAKFEVHVNNTCKQICANVVKAKVAQAHSTNTQGVAFSHHDASSLNTKQHR